MGYILRYIAARLAFQGLQRVGFSRILVTIGALVVLVALFLAPFWKG